MCWFYKSIVLFIHNKKLVNIIIISFKWCVIILRTSQNSKYHYIQQMIDNLVILPITRKVKKSKAINNIVNAADKNDHPL